jgi:hypothetical protein
MPIDILENNAEYRYMLFKSSYIADCLPEILYQTSIIADTIKERLQSVDSNVTWLYKKYNVFAYASGSPAYFSIFKDLIDCIKIYKAEYNLPTYNLWMRNWINYHDYDEVLKLHDHDVLAHGYISIDPQHTETVFVDDFDIERYSVINSPGQIYLGPGRRKHYVKNLENYTNKRITIGLDLETNLAPGVNLGCLPVIL